jgi:energy-coupling factor transport system permease protein
MLAIYAYATPGEYVGALPEWFAPTYEGLREGGMQMLRLVLMLAAISLLLATTDRSRLMSGLYWLLQPLRFFRIDPARFAARLWLTLHYVETMPKGVFHLLRQQDWRLESVLRFETEAPETVVLSFPAMRVFDWLSLVGLTLAMMVLAAGWVR